MSEPTTRFTLRQLPLPAKLVATAFLLTVGLGYSSAMVQMHFQHTKGDGAPMPMLDDVVEVFAGKKKYVKPKEGEEPPPPVSKLEKLVMGPTKGVPFNGSGSMAAAFFDRSPDYRQAVRLDKSKVDAEREGERRILQLWINAAETERRTAYDTDRFAVPSDKVPTAITEKFLHDDRSSYKVKSILADRCVTCHGDGGEQANFPLESYAQLMKYMEVPAAAEATVQEGELVRSDRQISKEKLAQSTHAHLLSFAMLFSLTGIIFAFTSYPGIVRGLLGPLVLVAQVADVSCWWLARLDGPGPYFAMCIILTGGTVGLGLCAQIVLSTFNMYALKGKLVLGGVFALGLGLGGLVMVTVALPQLEDEKRQAAERAESEKKKQAPTEKPTPAAPKVEPKPEPKAEPKVEPTPKVIYGPSKMEVAFTGPYKEGGPWGAEQGGMIRAFYDKESEYKSAIKEKDAVLLKELTPQREGEHAVFLAWIKSPADVRKKAYEDDKFEIPADRRGKPMTPEFLADDKTVKVKTIVELRCASCHTEGSNAPSFDTFEEMDKFLQPEPLTPKKDAETTTPKAESQQRPPTAVGGRYPHPRLWVRVTPATSAPVPSRLSLRPGGSRRANAEPTAARPHPRL